MLNKSKVDLLAFENKNIGYGHVRRTKYLYNYLNNFYNCKIYINKFPQINSNVEEKIIILFIIFKIRKSKQTKKKILYNWIRLFWKQKIDTNIVIFRHKKSNQDTLYSGKKFIFLDKINIKKTKKKIIKKNILVFFGTSNKKNLSYKFAYRLDRIGFNVNLVVGKYSREIIKYRKKIKNLNIKFRPKKFLNLMKEAEIVFTNAGNTLFESMYLKKKIWSIPQSKFEKNINNYLFKKKSICLEKLNLKNLDEITNTPKYPKLPFKGEIEIKKIIDKCIKINEKKNKS